MPIRVQNSEKCTVKVLELGKDSIGQKLHQPVCIDQQLPHCLAGFLLNGAIS